MDKTGKSKKKSKNQKKVILIILDGFGLRKSRNANAAKLAKAQNINNYFSNYPFTELDASGNSVGLPKGFMGNSEVGHLTLGAGRIILQDMTMIDNTIHAPGDKPESFFKNPVLLGAITHAKKHNSSLHLMGLLSDAGVHSHIGHLFALLEMCKQQGFLNVHVHCFMDGRDTPPKSGLKYIAALEKKMHSLGIGSISTVIGRYYAMDRDQRWDRQEKAYDLLVFHKGKKYKTAKEAILDNYKRGITDEFVEPSVIKSCTPTSCTPTTCTPTTCTPTSCTPTSCTPTTINDYDSVIFFNFRSDRARQLTRALAQRTFKSFKRPWLRQLHFVGMTKYEKKLRIKIAFPEKPVKNSMGEYLSKNKVKQLRIAETEKYAHVTFFFNAGIEKPYAGESRILVNSPKVATYDLKPEMSCYEVRTKVVAEIKKKKYGFILLNFANPDMVGHTGKLDAAIKAVEAVDPCLGEVVSTALSKGYICIVTADHGNCEEMKGKHATSHTLNKVPFTIVSNAPELQKGKIKLEKASLCDVSPTILELMSIKKPLEMTGKSIINHKQNKS